MANIRRNNLKGSLSADLVLNGVNMQSAALASMPVIAAPDYMWVTIGIRDATPEIVKVTAHAAGAQAATVVRAQQSTLGGRADAPLWPTGTEWEHTPTAEDFGVSFAETFVLGSPVYG